MSNEVMRNLLDLIGASSMALGLIVLLRRPARRWLGSLFVYQTWLVVPVAIVAASLPASLPTWRAAHVPLAAAMPTLRLSSYGAPMIAAHGFGWTTSLTLAWLMGALGMLCWCCFEHARFVRALGKLERRGDVYMSQSVDGGPALVGFWRPKIVLPNDFASRYTAREQALIIAHERVHLARRDPLANLVCGAIVCVFWFNPLVHFAARCFRFDQELACDDAVLQVEPLAVRSYAEAMLKSQTAHGGTLISCHWQSHHPLKERILNLNQSKPQGALRRIGVLLTVALACATAYSASATTPDADVTVTADGPAYMVAMKLNVGGKESEPILLVKANEAFTIEVGEAGKTWSGEFTLTALKGDKVQLQSAITLAGKSLGHPTVLVKLGDEAGIVEKADDHNPGYDLRLHIERADPATPIKFHWPKQQGA